MPAPSMVGTTNADQCGCDLSVPTITCVNDVLADRDDGSDTYRLDTIPILCRLPCQRLPA